MTAQTNGTMYENIKAYFFTNSLVFWRMDLLPGLMVLIYTVYAIILPQERDEREPNSVKKADKLHINLFPTISIYL